MFSALGSFLFGLGGLIIKIATIGIIIFAITLTARGLCFIDSIPELITGNILKKSKTLASQSQQGDVTSMYGKALRSLLLIAGIYFCTLTGAFFVIIGGICILLYAFFKLGKGTFNSKVGFLKNKANNCLNNARYVKDSAKNMVSTHRTTRQLEKEMLARNRPGSVNPMSEEEYNERLRSIEEERDYKNHKAQYLKQTGYKDYTQYLPNRFQDNTYDAYGNMQGQFTYKPPKNYGQSYTQPSGGMMMSPPPSMEDNGIKIRHKKFKSQADLADIAEDDDSLKNEYINMMNTQNQPKRKTQYKDFYNSQYTDKQYTTEETTVDEYQNLTPNITQPRRNNKQALNDIMYDDMMQDNVSINKSDDIQGNIVTQPTQTDQNIRQNNISHNSDLNKMDTTNDLNTQPEQTLTMPHTFVNIDEEGNELEVVGPFQNKIADIDPVTGKQVYNPIKEVPTSYATNVDSVAFTSEANIKINTSISQMKSTLSKLEQFKGDCNYTIDGIKLMIDNNTFTAQEANIQENYLKGDMLNSFNMLTQEFNTGAKQLYVMLTDETIQLPTDKDELVQSYQENVNKYNELANEIADLLNQIDNMIQSVTN